jgi:hypothetical protein
MDSRSLGKGTGDHDEAQQEAEDWKEMHDVLFGVWFGVARRLRLDCDEVEIAMTRTGKFEFLIEATKIWSLCGERKKKSA